MYMGAPTWPPTPQGDSERLGKAVTLVDTPPAGAGVTVAGVR